MESGGQRRPRYVAALASAIVSNKEGHRMEAVVVFVVIILIVSWLVKLLSTSSVD